MLNEHKKREYPRLDVALELFKPTGELWGVTKNISLGGCFIKTKEHTNDAFNVSFLLTPDNRVVNTSCEVKWGNNSGVGTAWTLNIKYKNILSDWLFLKGLQDEQSK